MYLTEREINGKKYLYFEDRLNGVIFSVSIGPKVDSGDIVKQKITSFIDKKTNLLKEHECSQKHKYLSNQQILKLIEIKTIYDIYNYFIDEKEKRSYYDKWIVDYVYTTTSIEGNTLSRIQTSEVLDGKTVSGKNLREIYEISNYKLLEDYKKTNKLKIDLSSIKKIHNILLNNIDEEGKGKLRNVQVFLRGVDYEPPPEIVVQTELEDLLKQYNNDNIHYFEKACVFHQRFEEIHPFVDGNGRTGRELFNLTLEKNNLPKIYVPVEKREEYLKALSEGNKKQYKPLINFFYNLLLEQSEIYYKSLRSKGFNIIEIK
jgi:Fic family protein